MNRETEMYHTAIRILENRADQLGDDELMHRVDNAELLKKKERMLNQSKWERNKRTKKYDPESGIMYNRRSDPDITAEAGKHGYVDLDSGRVYPHKGGKLFSGPLLPNKSGVSGSDTAAAKKKFSEVLNNVITDEQIRDMFKNGNSRKDISENIYWKVYKEYGGNPTNLPTATEQWIDEKITKAVKHK